MKKLLLLLMLLCSTWALAQDVIVKTDGSSVLCRIVEVNSTEVVYKKWSDLKGSNYVMNRKDVSTINYESGKKEDISLLDNKYSPYNQNTGYGQMNDNALARMDAIMDYQKKAKKAKLSGWIVGGISAAVGVLFAADAAGVDIGFGCEPPMRLAISGLCIAGGVGCVLGGNAISNHYKKKAQMLQSTALLQQGIQFNDGSSLALGIDVIQDKTMNINTFGMGIRYNF